MYIVFDMEFNQDFSNIGEKIMGSLFPFEIIQIGAVKLNSQLNIIDSFNQYIKPEIYDRVSPFIEELTGITSEMLKDEKSFPEVYNDFIDFIGDINSVFCVWGMADIRELFKSAEYFKQNVNLLPKKYINLQPYASLYFHLPKKVQLKLENVIEMLKIPALNKFHNAQNDACYTANIFKKIYNEYIQPTIYDPKYVKPRIRQVKRVIDEDSLFKQLEKMYDRIMTEEEKSMIILAYKMGKTNQFLIDAQVDASSKN